VANADILLGSSSCRARLGQIGHRAELAVLCLQAVAESATV